MCDLLIPGLIIAGIVGITATQSGNSCAPACQPVCAPVCAPMEAPPAWTPAARYTYTSQYTTPQHSGAQFSHPRYPLVRYEGRNVVYNARAYNTPSHPH